MEKIRQKQILIDKDVEVNGFQLKNAIIELVANEDDAYIDLGRLSYAQDTKTLYIGDGTAAQLVGAIPSLDNIAKINFNTNYEITGLEPDGTIYWNGAYHTLEYKNGLYTFKLGQVEYYVFCNQTGATIEPFKVLHLNNICTIDGNLYPTFELSDASKWEKTQGTLIVTCKSVANGELGIGVQRAQLLEGGSTLGIPVGSQLWLSDDGSGSITEIKPVFPSFSVSIGGNYNATAAPNGKILVNITGDINDTFHDAWDGAIRESFNFTVDSNGTVVTGTIENVNSSNNLTLLFSSGFYTLDTTTAPLTVALTVGTDASTQTNYVYIPISTKVLTISTTGFPTTEHCKVAQLEVQSAATVQSEGGARRNQNINDHLKSENNNGHILHIAERLRQLNAEHNSGTEGTLTGTPTNGYIQITSGQVWQLHKQTFAAKSMPTNSALIVNDFTTAYRSTVNLNTITAYSDGSAWSNEWSNIVVWGVANKSGEPSYIMVNLPSAGYNSEDNAIADVSNYTDYSIPDKYKGVGFLIGRYTIRISGGTITYNGGYTDLRGFVPNNVAGGGTGGGGVTSLLALSDTPTSYIGNKGKFLAVNDAENAMEFTTPKVWERYTAAFVRNSTSQITITGVDVDNWQGRSLRVTSGSTVTKHYVKTAVFGTNTVLTIIGAPLPLTIDKLEQDNGLKTIVLDYKVWWGGLSEATDGSTTYQQLQDYNRNYNKYRNAKGNITGIFVDTKGTIAGTPTLNVYNTGTTGNVLTANMAITSNAQTDCGVTLDYANSRIKAGELPRLFNTATGGLDYGADHIATLIITMD